MYRGKLTWTPIIHTVEMKIIFYGYLVSVPGRVYHGIPLHYNFLLKNPQLAMLTAQTDPP